MFDSYTLRAGDTHHSHTHEIIEKRAPTDESVRLLAEFEEKARQKLLKTVRLEAMPFGCVIHHHRSVVENEDKFIVQYKLNGSERQVHYSYTGYSSGRKKREEIIEGLQTAVAKDVAAMLLWKAMSEAKGKLEGFLCGL